ncbi:Lipoyl synthase [hydrothermal vent metagenome]|uniref:lipoyl synthase n=1 Tax=hydrothermal vent metagenome TaxID=652676 RepID=A0A3B1DA55_9ZZZZ
MSAISNRLPSWFRQEIPNMEKINRMKSLFRGSDIHTVCESARCPNMGQCWGQGVATFMILGDICTRACRFCAVKAGKPLAVDKGEPKQVAQMVKKLNLRYVVITSVTRDDLKDEGASQFTQTIVSIKDVISQTKVEVLIPDFSNRRELLNEIIDAHPDVVSHNVETVQRLSIHVRPQANYQRSLDVLRNLKKLDASALVKTSFMVGMGETDDEIKELMEDILGTGCDMLTIGQYLAPTKLKRHFQVNHFVPEEKFLMYKQIGLELGFKHIMSAPLVRSSYIAEQGYKEAVC